jgi:hypothetical protein
MLQARTAAHCSLPTLLYCCCAVWHNHLEAYRALGELRGAAVALVDGPPLAPSNNREARANLNSMRRPLVAKVSHHRNRESCRSARLAFTVGTAREHTFAFVALGTPCMNFWLTADVNANMSPLFCGNENIWPVGSCRNCSSRDAPNEAPCVADEMYLWQV